MSIMGCKSDVLLWDGHREGEVTNYYGMLVLGPGVKKLVKDGYYGMSEVGKGLVAKGLQCHEMSTALAYMCVRSVYVCLCVSVGCPCVLWDGQEVGGCPGDARARAPRGRGQRLPERRGGGGCPGDLG